MSARETTKFCVPPRVRTTTILIIAPPLSLSLSDSDHMSSFAQPADSDTGGQPAAPDIPVCSTPESEDVIHDRTSQGFLAMPSRLYRHLPPPDGSDPSSQIFHPDEETCALPKQVGGVLEVIGPEVTCEPSQSQTASSPAWESGIDPTCYVMVQSRAPGEPRGSLPPHSLQSDFTSLPRHSMYT